jgi:hypothetical protein
MLLLLVLRSEAHCSTTHFDSSASGAVLGTTATRGFSGSSSASTAISLLSGILRRSCALNRVIMITFAISAIITAAVKHTFISKRHSMIIAINSDAVLLLQAMVDGALQDLADSDCIEFSADSERVKSTALGRIASYYYLDHSTVVMDSTVLEGDGGDELQVPELCRYKRYFKFMLIDTFL